MTTSVSRDTARPIRPVPNGCGQYRWPERRSSVEACAEEGGKRAEPAPAPSKGGALVGLLLVLTGWPLVAVIVALVVFLVEHLPKLPN